MDAVAAVRRQTGLTQRELARRAGTSQATISAYESGKKSPTWRTLTALAAAAGVELVAVVVPPLTREDRRSLALHEAIAAALLADPEAVIARARRNIETMRRVHPFGVPLLDEWRTILDRPAEEIAEVLRDPRPHARELRHLTPFAGVLGPAERARVYRVFREAEAQREA